MAVSDPPPALDLQAFAEALHVQLLIERDMLLAWVDARERLLDIHPRTAEVRKWYKEKNGCRMDGQNGGGHESQG